MPSFDMNNYDLYDELIRLEDAGIIENCDALYSDYFGSGLLPSVWFNEIFPIVEE